MHAFCGREQELERLLATWEKVKPGTSGPRAVVLLAESGLGKTRLAQEFFGRLSRSENADGTFGYWPDDLGRDGNNLRINPPEASCDAAAAMPFLWWGLRLVDPLAHNQLAASVLATHVERDLVPHLEPMHRAQRQRQRLGQLAKVGGGLAADAVIDLIPFLGLAKTIGETGMEIKELHAGWRKDRVALDAGGLAAERRASLVDRVIGDLTALFSGKAGSRVPGVILIDDAQFSTEDPGLVAFTEDLLAAMTGKSWPLLLLVTHWEREWAQQASDDAPTVASAIQSYSVLHPGRVECLRMAPVADLGPMLREALPGLAPDQAAALLGRADGNPRFLDEILRVATSVRGRALFVGRDPSGPMTDAGLADLLARSVALHDLIAERLAASPEPVQKAVALASMQGSEFLRRLVGETADALDEPAEVIGGAISEAQTPHAYVAEVSEDVAAFAQRLYHEAASELLPAWFDPEAAEAALRDVVRRMATAEGGIVLSDTDLAYYCALAAGLLEHSADEQDRRIAASALSRLIDGAEARGDVHSALALARRLASVIENVSDGWLDSDLNWLRQINRIFADVSDREARRPVLLRLLKMTQATHEEEPGVWSGWMYALALVQVGDFLGEEGNAESAATAYLDAFQTMAALPSEELDVAALETYAIVCERVGDALHARGDLENARSLQIQGRQLSERVDEIDPGPVRSLNLSVSERKLGTLALAARDSTAARQHYAKAIALARDGVAQHPVPQAEGILAAALDCSAELLTIQDELQAAAALLLEGLAIRRRHRDAADTIGHRAILAASLHKLAVNAWMLDDLETASSRIGEAVDLLRGAAAASGDPDLRSLYVSCLAQASRFALGRRDFDAARPLAEEALSLARDAAKASDHALIQYRLLETLAVAVPLIAGKEGTAAVHPVLAEADAAFAAIHESVRWGAFATMAEIEEIRAKVLEHEGDPAGAAAARRRSAELAASAIGQESLDPQAGGDPG